MNSNPTAAIVVEGGGMRGVFSAGVLDRFLEEGFDPFEIHLGVSAGACNLASHLGNQHGRNYRSYTEYMLAPDFFNLKKFLRGGHYMDLDWFWDYIAGIEPLNVQGASARNLLVGVTNARTGEAEYIPAKADTLLDTLKASSAVPLLYRGFLTLNGSEYLDGGIADPIPFEEAIKRGARNIMVIRSQTAGYVKKSGIESKWIPMLFGKYPALKKALRERSDRYNQTLKQLKNPPPEINLIEICPSVLHSGRTTKDKNSLELDYQAGKEAGLTAIKRWMEIQ